LLHKKFWPLLRVPLHRYLTHCLRTKNLSSTFKTAKIKIIPKKVTVKKLAIGARFPYSVVYTKDLSRALNNRLKKVRDIIFSRAQKGFTNQRHIQEVLINVIEGIAHCKHNNIPACILSIDQAKAFDSVSHSYKKGSSNFLGSVQISLTFSIHCVPVKEVIKEQPTPRNLSATATRVLLCTYMPCCSFWEIFFSYSHLNSPHT